MCVSVSLLTMLFDVIIQYSRLPCMYFIVKIKLLSVLRVIYKWNSVKLFQIKKGHFDWTWFQSGEVDVNWASLIPRKLCSITKPVLLNQTFGRVSLLVFFAWNKVCYNLHRRNKSGFCFRKKLGKLSWRRVVVSASDQQRHHSGTWK